MTNPNIKKTILLSLNIFHPDKSIILLEEIPITVKKLVDDYKNRHPDYHDRLVHVYLTGRREVVDHMDVVKAIIEEFEKLTDQWLHIHLHIIRPDKIDIHVLDKVKDIIEYYGPYPRILVSVEYRLMFNDNVIELLELSSEIKKISKKHLRIWYILNKRNIEHLNYYLDLIDDYDLSPNTCLLFSPDIVSSFCGDIFDKFAKLGVTTIRELVNMSIYMASHFTKAELTCYNVDGSIFRVNANEANKLSHSLLNAAATMCSVAQKVLEQTDEF